MTDARVVSFLSSKGGSGKTVIASSLGTYLAGLGFKVLLVDTDAATNGMTLLFLEQLLNWKRLREVQSSTRVGLFEAENDVEVSVLHINEFLDFVPATYSMSNTEAVDLRKFELALDQVIHAGEYDFILLDAQAGADNFARTAAERSDTTVLVSEYDPVSIQGIDRLKILFGDVLEPSRTLTLFNKVLPEFAKLIGEGLAVARVLPPVSWDADVVRAFTRRDLAVDLKSPNTFTIAIAQVALSLFTDDVFEKVAKWQGGALTEIVQPAEAKFSELELVVQKLRRGQRVRQWLLRATTALFFMFAVIAGILQPYFVVGERISEAFSSILFVTMGAIAAISLFGFRAGMFTTPALEDALAQQAKLTSLIDAKTALLSVGNGGLYGQLRRAELSDRRNSQSRQ